MNVMLETAERRLATQGTVKLPKAARKKSGLSDSRSRPGLAVDLKPQPSSFTRPRAPRRRVSCPVAVHPPSSCDILAQSPGALLAPRKPTVLVVDDEEVLREVVALTLEKGGYHVLTAGDGEEALEVAKQWGKPIELLFTDVVMPRMNGGELAARMIRAYPEISVIFASGYTEGARSEYGIPENVRLLPKPYSLKSLLEAVHDHLPH